MNKRYLVSYHGGFGNGDYKRFEIEVPTREEADQKAEDLQEERYENIIIEEIKS